MHGDDQDALLRWVLAELASPGSGALHELRSMSWDRCRAAGLTSGLTALVAALAAAHDIELPATWIDGLTEQRAAVATRQQRFATTIPRVLGALAAADVVAVPVKGAVLTATVWPHPEARPMADLDVVVAAADRQRARHALERAGMSLHASTSWEDTFLAWGDGSVGRTDGESADHNGKVELHPGWVERLHDYLVDDGGVVLATAAPGELLGAPCHLLPPGATAAYVVGHLAASAIRREVRAVNVVDAVLVLARLDGHERSRLDDLVGRIDPRLTAPGLWLTRCYAPDPSIVPDALHRLPAAARAALGGARPLDLLRGGQRTTFAWRRAFATSPTETAHVVRQLVWPPRHELAPNGSPASTMRLQLDRLRRRVGR